MDGGILGFEVPSELFLASIVDDENDVYKGMFSECTSIKKSNSGVVHWSNELGGTFGGTFVR